MLLDDQLSFPQDYEEFKNQYSPDQSADQWVQVFPEDILKLQKIAKVDFYALYNGTYSWGTLQRDGESATLTFDNTEEHISFINVDAEDCLIISNEGQLWVRSKDLTKGTVHSQSPQIISFALSNNKGFSVFGETESSGGTTVVEVSQGSLILNSPNIKSYIANILNPVKQISYVYNIVTSNTTSRSLRLNNPRRLQTPDAVAINLRAIINVESPISDECALIMRVDEVDHILSTYTSPGQIAINEIFNVGDIIPINCTNIDFYYRNENGLISDWTLSRIAFSSQVDCSDGITDTFMAYKDGNQLVIRSDTGEMIRTAFTDDPSLDKQVLLSTEEIKDPVYNDIILLDQTLITGNPNVKDIIYTVQGTLLEITSTSPLQGRILSGGGNSYGVLDLGEIIFNPGYVQIIDKAAISSYKGGPPRIGTILYDLAANIAIITNEQSSTEWEVFIMSKVQSGSGQSTPLALSQMEFTNIDPMSPISVPISSITMLYGILSSGTLIWDFKGRIGLLNSIDEITGNWNGMLLSTITQPGADIHFLSPSDYDNLDEQTAQKGTIYIKKISSTGYGLNIGDLFEPTIIMGTAFESFEFINNGDENLIEFTDIDSGSTYNIRVTKDEDYMKIGFYIGQFSMERILYSNGWDEQELVSANQMFAGRTYEVTQKIGTVAFEKDAWAFFKVILK